MIGLHAAAESLAHVLWDVKVFLECSVLNIFDIVLVELIDVVLHLDNGRRVGRDKDRRVVLNAEAHDGIVARAVILNLKYLCGG